MRRGVVVPSLLILFQICWPAVNHWVLNGIAMVQKALDTQGNKFLMQLYYSKCIAYYPLLNDLHIIVYLPYRSLLTILNICNFKLMQ